MRFTAYNLNHSTNLLISIEHLDTIEEIQEYGEKLRKMGRGFFILDVFDLGEYVYTVEYILNDSDTWDVVRKFKRDLTSRTLKEAE